MSYTNNTNKETRIVGFDWAIKNLLRNKANFDILEGFLSELLKRKIEIEALLESESNQENSDDKYNRVDLLVKTSTNEKIIIEVQTASQWDYYHRILFGTSKLINEYIDTNDPYHKIAQVISVNILFFNLGNGKDYVYKGCTEFKGVHMGDVLDLTKNSVNLYLRNTDRTVSTPADLFPTYYIIQLKKFADVIRDKFDEWVYLLKHETVKPGFSARGVLSAKEKLDILKLSEKERRSYYRDMDNKRDKASTAASYDIDLTMAREESREEGREAGLREGREEGREEGRLVEKREIAKKLKAAKLPVAQIAIITELSHEEIKAL